MMEEMSAALFILCGPIPKQQADRHPHRNPCLARPTLPLSQAAASRLRTLIDRARAGTWRPAWIGIHLEPSPNFASDLK